MPNYEDIALIREDTREVLPIYGATSVVFDRPGVVTQYPVPDRSHVARGTTLNPNTIDVEAVESPNFSGASEAGQARLDKVENYLDKARADGATVSFRRPSGALVASMVVESYRTAEGNEEGFRLSLRLQAVKFAVSRSVQALVAPGEPLPAARATVEPVEETGPGAAVELPEESDTSFLKSVTNFVTSFAG